MAHDDFGGDFDPVRTAVDEAVSSFSSRQPEDDRRIWLKIANEIGYDAFRDLYLEQCAIMREYKLRNPSAAFQNRLNRYTGHNTGTASQRQSAPCSVAAIRGSGQSPVLWSAKGDAR